MPSLYLEPRGTVTVDGETVTDPDTWAFAEMVVSFESERQARTIVHDTPGADAAAEAGWGDVQVVTLRPAGPRAGTLEMIFTNATDARRAEVIHSRPGRIFLNDPDWFDGVFSYVAQGNIRLTRTDSRRAWLLTTGFSELG